MNEQEQRAQHSGRTYCARAYGDTPDELELSALDKAREIFGKGARLELVHTYTIREVILLPSADKRYAGKKLQAEIRVLVHE